ncbi:MAG: hypothetical protein IKC87_06725 [Clostridia bacterium]|nr:hypothetical protein [Clostridia bacterium]
MESLTGQLKELHIQYTKETTEKGRHYDKLLADLKKKLKDIEATDYDLPYIKRYQDFYNELTPFVEKIKAIEAKTHHLAGRDTLGGYIDEHTRSDTRDTEFYSNDGRIESIFFDRVQYCEHTLSLLEKATTVEECQGELRNLAIIYTEMKFIIDNSRKILADSDIPGAKKREDVKCAKEAIEKATLEMQKALKFENLECYPALTRLVKQYKDNYKRVSRDILGSESEAFYFDTEYRYLIGFYKEDIPEGDRKFARDVLGLSDAELSSQPIYFEPERSHHNIIINAKAAEFEKPLYQTFIRQLYFSLARRLPANGLKYSAIACNKSTNGMFVSHLNNFIESLSDNGLYIEAGVVGDGGKFQNAVNDLREKSLHFKTSDNSDIYEFNRTSSVDRKPMHVTFVDSYPIGMDNHSEGIASLVQLIIEGKRSGYLTVLSQATDAFENMHSGPIKPPPKFENVGKKFDAMEICISGDKVTVDGKPAVLDIAAPGFSDRDYVAYWGKLKEYYNKKDVFYLEKLFDDIDTKDARGKRDEESVLLTGKMSIPLGYVGTDLYEAEYDLNKACHAFILGASGSGKSSFLHTFILGTAYKYSPKEVEFYLADWKRAELEVYKSHPLPHVKYLQDNSSVSEYVSLLQMLLRICSHRNALIRSKGQTSFLGYNRVVPEEERMPFIFFIVDEYQVMIEQNNETNASSNSKRMAKAWLGLMGSILGIVRSAGIGVVLSSQSLDKITFDFSNVQKRMLLGLNQQLLGELCYNNDSKAKSSEAFKQDEQYLSVAQSGHVVLGFAGKTKTDRFRSAYTGDGAIREKSIDRICDRWFEYGIDMILGGSKESFPITELTEPPYSSMLDEVKRNSAFDDDFDDSPVDDTTYPVFIGVTSNDTTPVPLQFNVKGTGYAVYTQSPARMRMIIRSAMLSFLYKTTSYTRRYEAKREYYFGSEDDYLHDIGRVCQAEPFLEPYIEGFDTEYEVYKSVSAFMDIYRIYEERKKARSQRGGFPPMLLVLRDLAWITENLDDTYDRYREDAEDARENARESDTGPDENELSAMIERIRAMNPELSDTKLRAMALRRMPMAKPKPKTESKIYSKDDIRDALKTLYKEGARFRIFVIAASTQQTGFKSLRDICFKSNDAPLLKYSVFGSQLENDGKFIDSVSGDGDVNTCFVYPAPKSRLEGESGDTDGDVGELTRLYRFGKTDYDYWDELEERLSGKEKNKSILEDDDF